MECIFLRSPTYVNGSSLAEIVKIENKGSEIKMMLTEDLVIQIKSDWLFKICFTFVTKSPGSNASISLAVNILRVTPGISHSTAVPLAKSCTLRSFR